MQNFLIFKNKIFRYFFAASLIGVLGEGIFGLTSIVIIMKETNSVMAIGYLLVLTMLPSVFLAPFGGVIIDRMNKSSIAIICNILRFVSIVVLPILIYFGSFSTEVLYISIFFSYIFWYILVPNTESMLKEALDEDQYVQGVSFTQAAWQVGLLSSAVIAGILMEYVGTTETLLIASLTYLIGALLFVKISKVYKIVKDHNVINKFSLKGYMKDIRQGWNYLYQNKTVFYFSLAACIVGPFFSAINILIAPFNYRILSGNEFTLGIIDSAAGIGSLISAGFCLILSRKKEVPFYLVISLIFLGTSTLLFSFSNHYFIAFLLYMLLGVFIGNVKVLSKSLVYKYVEQSYVGRTMSTISMLSLSLAIMTSLVVGYLGEKDIRLAYYLIAFSLLCPIILTILGYRSIGSGSLDMSRDQLKGDITH